MKKTLQTIGFGVLIFSLGTLVGSMIVSGGVYGITVITAVLGILLVVRSMFTSK